MSFFVTDPVLAGMAQAFEWSFTENEGPPETHITQFGEISYLPKSVCNLTVSVRLKDAVNADLANLTLTQIVRLINKELELTILLESAKVGPSVGNLDVSRELVNDYSPYYQSVTLQSPEEGDAFQRFVFGLTRNGALQRLPALRKRHSEQLASSLNEDNYDFSNLIAQGVGICAIRLPLLAMSLTETSGSANTFLKWTELPEVQVKRAPAEIQLNQDFAGLVESKRLDLFNLLRFSEKQYCSVWANHRNSAQSIFSWN